MNNDPMGASQRKIRESVAIAKRIRDDLEAARRASATLVEKKKGKASGGGRVTLVMLVLLLVGVAWLVTRR